MTTPLDPYAVASSALPSAVQSIIPGNAIGANSQTINTAEINLSSSGGGAVLGYTGSPAAGNLVFSLSSASGTDTFGNSVATGLSVTSGNITGVSLTGVQMDSTSTLQNTQINQATVLAPTIAGGTASSLTQTMTNTNGGVLGYLSGTFAATYSTNGNYSWTCPTGVTTVNIQCWGAGGGGGGGGSLGGTSGGGGEFAQEPNFTVVPGAVYSIIVGQGGSGGTTNESGGSGSATVFQSQNGGGSSVTANGGAGGAGGIGGNGGTGSSNTVHFDGGDGANASSNTGGAGGAGSASASGEGNDGNESSSSTGASGASAISGGGAGGAGGNAASNGVNGGSPGGGGGGAGANSVVNSSNTYTPNVGTYAYRGPNATSSPNALINHDGPMYQGYPDATYGSQYSFMSLPYTTIQSDLSGLNVTSVSLRIKCLYSYYSSGVYCTVQYSATDYWGSTGSSSGGTVVKNFLMQQNQTVTENLGLGGGIGVALQNGNAKSIMFYNRLTPAGDYYGSFDSGAGNGVEPELIVYYNNGGGSTAGTGSDGQCIITYGSSVPTFQLSVSATTTTDLFGNTIQPGFQGPLLTLTNQTTTISTNTSATSIGSNTAGTPTVTNSQGFTGQMASNQADTGHYVVTSTSLVPMWKAYNIPAGDAQVGTTYRLTAWGDYTTGASAQAITWTIIGWGATTAASATWGQAPTTANTTYQWFMQGIAQVTATGSAGSVQTVISGNMGLFNQNLGNISTDYGGGIVGGYGAGGPAINTTTAATFGLQMKLGGPNTAHCYGSILERLGP